MEIEILVKYYSSKIPFITILVPVPMSVLTPPIVAAYEIPMKYAIVGFVGFSLKTIEKHIKYRRIIKYREHGVLHL